MTDDYSNLVDYSDGATSHRRIEVTRQTKNPDVLSEAFVLELHKRLFGSVWKWAGTFDVQKVVFKRV